MTDPNSLESKYQRAAEAIRADDALIVTAGAGMGVDSGLPVFRGTEGFWNSYPRLAKGRVRFQDIANPTSFRTQPSQTWGFYAHRLNLYRRTVPYDGFAILRRIGATMPNGMIVYTSNVDGQFQRAGVGDGRIYECHGSIHYLQCVNGCREAIWPADDFHPDVDEDNCLLVSALPRCRYYRGLARPNILMFNDWNWLSRRAERQAAPLEGWLSGIRQPVIIEVGAGAGIPTVRRFSQRQKGLLIRINPAEHERNSPTLMVFQMGGLEALRRIEAATLGT